MRLSRLELLRRAAALAVVSRLRLLEQAFGSTPNTVRQTLDALVEFVVGDRKLVVATTPRLIRTLDRFLPGALPLSSTASSILNGAAAQVRSEATFAQLTGAQKEKAFETIESLPVDSAGSIQFLVGNLQDLTAFLAYSTPRGRRLSHYAGPVHGHKELRVIGMAAVRDVIVVGAGGGGPVVAKELAARGLDVLLLEAGPAWRDPEQEWSHDENTANNPATGIFRFGPSDRSQPPWARDLPQNCFVWQTAGVGGSTLHYFGNSPRAMPDALPDYADLIRYYEWVEQTLPVQTAAMGTKEELFLHAATKLGLPTQTAKDITRAACRPQENAILQPHGTAGTTSKAKQLVYPRAKGCTFCGHCPQGCFLPLKAPLNLKAKRSTHVSYVPMALTADRWTRGRAATLVTDAFAVKVGADGQRRSVTWANTRTGALSTEEATVVVLAAGAIETPRLWLNSGLPNPNDQVGRGLTDHYLDFVVGRLPRYTGSSKGPTSAARADFPGYGCIEQAGVAPGLQAQGLTGSNEPRLRLHGNRLRRFLSNLDRLIAVAVITADDVSPRNRVTLSTVMTPDAHGPVARVELRERTVRTLENREFLAGRAVQLVRAAGAREVVRMNWAPVLLHIHSTMRIGAVLTSDAESRWVERLFVADNSALPNALGGPNPTLTTQALATRTAEKIFVRYFGGDAWVGRESPVSSIDDTVTRAVIASGL